MNQHLFQIGFRSRVSLRIAALALFSGAALLLAGPGCSIIESQQDCEKSCDLLNQCGVLESDSCGAYCAGFVAGAAVAGCGDEFDAQNECGKTIDECGASAAKCATQVKAFADCMAAYCKETPGGQGCP